MSSQMLLIKAIRAGHLAGVRAALDGGAHAELEDGLPMGIACFMGHVEIVRELAARGGQINLADNTLPTSPLSMALRGKRTEVVRTLLELGLDLPPGTVTELTENEIMIAQWKAQRDGHAAPLELDPAELPNIEEIVMPGCAGTDTVVLEADALRIARDMR